MYHRGRHRPCPICRSKSGSTAPGIWRSWAATRIAPGCSTGAREVGPHSHARGTGLEFGIDARLLTPAKAALLSGLTVSVAQGAYLHNGALLLVGRWGDHGDAAGERQPVGVGGDRAGRGGRDADRRQRDGGVVSAPLEPSTVPAIRLAGRSRWRRCGCATGRPNWTRTISRICASRSAGAAAITR
ncbi:MAG: hypothetical protein U0521_17190 [Anaerolineae bacterium]